MLRDQSPRSALTKIQSMACLVMLFFSPLTLGHAQDGKHNEQTKSLKIIPYGDEMDWEWDLDLDFDFDLELPELDWGLPVLYDMADDMEGMFSYLQDLDQEEQMEELLRRQEELQEEAEARSEELRWRTAEEARRMQEFLVEPKLAAGTKKEITEAYQVAYSLILEEKWKEARQALEEFLRQYAKTRYTDDARFWLCYAMEKLSLPDEEVFEAYQLFIQEFPRSKWEDDAKGNLISIGRRLVGSGRKEKAQYGPILEDLQQDADLEVAMEALYGLRRKGDKSSLQTVIRLYDPESDARLRKRIVHTLSHFDDPEALDKLAQIAHEDPDPGVRESAIEAIGRNSQEGYRVLVKIIKSEKDASIRRKAVQSLRRMENKEVVTLLLDIARNDPHVKVRTAAVAVLSRLDTPEAQEALIKLLEGK